MLSEDAPKRCQSTKSVLQWTGKHCRTFTRLAVTRPCRSYLVLTFTSLPFFCSRFILNTAASVCRRRKLGHVADHTQVKHPKLGFSLVGLPGENPIPLQTTKGFAWGIFIVLFSHFITKINFPCVNFPEVESVTRENATFPRKAASCNHSYYCRVFALITTYFWVCFQKRFYRLT